MATRKRDRMETLLEEVHAARKDPRGETARETLARALSAGNWLVVSEASKLVGEHALTHLAPALRDVWPRFVSNAAKTDPGCRAKEAALSALDRLELLEPEPFLLAVRYQQLEPAARGRVDTAAGVRQRALLALFRMQHADAALYAGELLADPDPALRVGVVLAIGHYAERSLAGLVLFKLQSGDAEPAVVSQCAATLLSLVPEFALGVLERWLHGSDETRRAVAALAFGGSQRSDAIALLIAWVEDSSLEQDIDIGLHALGLCRDERAREYLLGVVERESQPRAERAVEALGTHRYDPSLVERVRRAAASNPRARLESWVNKIFGAATSASQ
jgi:hypothetical protein